MSSKLMPNYGWVQNTSNLSTIRDTLELVPDSGATHSDLMNRIREFRKKHNDLPKKWNWDARCRIKAIHALGLVTLNRHIQGYDLSALGKRLLKCPKSQTSHGKFRELSREEVLVFQEGLLTNPPVIRILELLYDDFKGKHTGLSKYDLGENLGFVGDIGFTHLDPYWVASKGFSFNDKEGDADKWARTIVSWLKQVDWVIAHGYQNINGKNLAVCTVSNEVEEILRYKIKCLNVPGEMLCSNHHPFPKLIQKRRSIILRALKAEAKTNADLIKALETETIEADKAIVEFEIINLKNAGLQIVENGGYYKLKNKIKLDYAPAAVETNYQDFDIEAEIQKDVVVYSSTIPHKYVDHLIRFGHDKDKHQEFESIINEYFRFLGFGVTKLGQGKGRVTDLIVKFVDQSRYAKSYGLIVDAKASGGRYSFPVGDKRKMKEYIDKHGRELLSEHIGKHAFSFISSLFADGVEKHLLEIRNETEISGCAINIDNLLKLGHKIKMQELEISSLYKYFICNKEITFA